jgi:acyl carrier protein
VTEQQMLDELEKWLRSQHDGDLTLDMDTDLVETGLVTSLKIVELTFLLGRVTGEKVALENLKLDQFRTMRSIAENFMRPREGLQ